MLTNQIAQLEVGNFHKHLPRGGYFLPKAHVLFFSGHGTSRLHHSVLVSSRLTLRVALGKKPPPRDITYTSTLHWSHDHVDIECSNYV